MEKNKKYLEIINEICKKTKPGKKMLQKLFYLMERSGVDLDLGYVIHFFGPYSSTLDDRIHMLEGMGIVNIDTSGKTHVISVEEETEINSVLNKNEKSKVHDVIEFYSGKSALDLEALTTIDYVAHVMLNDSSEKADILAKVKEIKGDKFTNTFLEEQYGVLKEQELI